MTGRDASAGDPTTSGAGRGRGSVVSAVIGAIAVFVLIAIVVTGGPSDDGSEDDTTSAAPGASPPGDRSPDPDDPVGSGDDTMVADPDTSDSAEEDVDPDDARGVAPPDPPSGDTEPPARPDCVGEADGVLTIGTLLPVTGALADLGPAGVAGAQLALEDINAAGGVLGAEVVLHHGDSGDTETDVATAEVDRLLDLGVDAIIGAVDSVVSFTVIDRITGACVIQFSPANTSPAFTSYDHGGLYFRTSPSDVLQGLVLSNLVLDDGNLTASVIVRQDADSEALAQSFRENFESSGGGIGEFITYSTNIDRVDDDGGLLLLTGAELDRLVRAGSDAVVVIGLDESAAIVTALHGRGIGPTATNVYGVGGNIRSIGAEIDDPGILTGLRGTEPAIDPDGIADFLARLDAIGDMGGVYTTAAETYDAVVILALAALVAGTDDPAAIAADVNAVTRPPGVECRSFADCTALIERGEVIDYVGVGGPYELTAGEPSAASFRIATYDGDRTPNPDLDEFVIVN